MQYPTDKIFRYTLNTAYDISTANIHPDSWQTLDINSVEQTNYSVTVKPDGTKLYHTGRSGDDINEWTLSTPWDLTSATHDGQTTLGGATTAWQHRWSSDGSKLYLINETGDLFKTYSLTTAWDSSTIGTPTDYTITSLIMHLVLSIGMPTALKYLLWALSTMIESVKQLYQLHMI